MHLDYLSQSELKMQSGKESEQDAESALFRVVTGLYPKLTCLWVDFFFKWKSKKHFSIASLYNAII